jgi:hypothetical protein
MPPDRPPPWQSGRRLKLRDLQILLTVAECGTMGKAARVLAVSQPVVSKAISDLERAVGVTLLDRVSVASRRPHTAERWSSAESRFSTRCSRV